MLPSFADLGVPAPLCATLARRGIAEPFPIQAATLPDALAGRDVAGKAPTGSGKTLVFGLAIAARAADSPRPEPRRPRALVLVPTRELAAQVQRELQALVDERRSGPVASIYGGVGYGPQRKMLARGVSAVVACPGRLEDLVATGDIRLDHAELVVLDEADRMADMGFMPAVRRLVDLTPDNRQTLLFSATLDGDVDALVRRYQRDPAHHEVSGHDDDGAEVSHLFWSIDRSERARLTADIIGRTGPTIVFSRTRHGADRITRQLGQAGVKAVPIHGRRSQAQRDQALRAFTAGRAPALVATDVAARGIHVDGVACVIHFDPVDEPKDYIHRSGRTGRAGASGVVVSLVSDDARKAVRTLQRELRRTEPIEPADVDRLARLGLAATAAAARPDAAAAPTAPAAASTTAAALPADDAPPASVTGRPTPTGRPATRTTVTGTPVTRTPVTGTAVTGTPVTGTPVTGTPVTGSAGQSGRRERPRPVRDPAKWSDRTGGERRPARGRDRRVAGTVKSFHPAKGYGFIARRGAADVFVHVSNVDGRHQSLEAGQRVRFDVAPGRRGEQAVNVQPV
jgi:superfamily II DNA/RNA helicase/cold shock CspA family protein